MDPDVLRKAAEMRDRWLLRGVVCLLVVALLVSAAGATLAYDPPEIEPGTVEEPANGSTIVSVQGFHYQGEEWQKKPARVAQFNETARLDWLYNGSGRLSNWFYDADPLPNGNVLVVNTYRTPDNEPRTAVYELDPDTGRQVWRRDLPLEDTHDVDLINGNQLLVGNMRAGKNDRAFIYDLGNDTTNWDEDRGVVWNWFFANHYSPSTDGGISSDWTHLNDVDKIGDGKYMMSPRNFDQVIVVDRESKNITLRLGEDVLPSEDASDSTLHEQHNPTYLETEDGKPVILVADSEHDRVVEYTCFNRSGATCDWELTWKIGVGGNLNWPRDADRLPNGNTLITDSLNHRVIEVTPEGQVVWEAYVSWGTYDAERVAIGEEPGGPTIRQQGASGAYEVNGSAQLTAGASDRPTFADVLSDTFAGTPISAEVDWFATRWSHIIPWIRPVWMSPWAFVSAATAVLVLLGWGGAELVVRRRRIADRARSLHPRLRRNLRSNGAGGSVESADATASDADGADED